MAWTDTPNSSNIAGFGHDPKTGILTIKFKNGGHYDHEGVPADLAEQMAKAESPGKFYHQSIKGKFQHKVRGL